MATVDLTPTQAAIFKTVGSFLVSILPDGFDIVQGQVNRVAQPRNPDFAVMWLLRQGRLSTNGHEFVDGVFTGSIAADVLTITAVDPNFAEPLKPGHQIFGVDMVAGTAIVSQTSGTPGGIGAYKVNKPQTFPSGLIAAGVANLTQATQTVLQVDVHGPSGADNATIITTAFRDEIAADFFASMSAAISPLYADDPKQVPFQNAEQQWEDRWIVEANIEVDYTVTFPQQFFTNVIANLINVDVVYPPEE